MKILEIIPQLNSGGAERFVVDLCNELSKRHTVKLIVFFSLKEHGFYCNDINENVSVYQLNKKKGLDPNVFIRIYKEIKTFNPDVVHTHLNAITYVLPSALYFKRPYFFHTVHNAAEKEYGDIIGYYVRKFSFKLKKIHPITISNESKISFNNFYRLPSTMIENGRFIPKNIVVSSEVIEEIESYKNSQHTKIISCVARIMEQKRQPFITKICKVLESEGYNFKLLFIGRKFDKKMVEEIEHTDCKSVKILGEKNNPLEYLKMSDGFCLMSSFEGLPISLIEALGTGCIPICTPVGGAKDIIKDGENGFLSKDISFNSCYEMLKRFLSLGTEEELAIKEKALNSFKSFTMGNCSLKYESLFLGKNKK